MNEEQLYSNDLKDVQEVSESLDEFSKKIEENALEDAYERSAKEYNELFDEFQRNEREARKQDGTYTMDDFLDDFEERREIINSSRRR